jgi:two-component system, cell cycle sensor histidine kinase and response regulator CckA
MPPADRRYRVLVVDDEASILLFVDRVLREAGYQTTMAPTADAALVVAPSIKPLDLLLTDMMMPGMSGDELARRLRLDEPDLRVLYLTGFADRLFTSRQVLWDNEAFIEKPVTVEALREAVSLAIFGHTRGPT